MNEETKRLREKWEADRLRREEAARRILEVSAELHLTWREFEEILNQVKGIAYLSSGSEPVKTS